MNEPAAPELVDDCCPVCGTHIDDMQFVSQKEEYQMEPSMEFGVECYEFTTTLKCECGYLFYTVDENC